MNFRTGLLIVAALLVGCSAASEPSTAEDGDGELDNAMPPTKADSPYTDCQLAQIAVMANDPATTADTLVAAGVASRAARGIIAHRDGPDGVAGTADDDRFDSAQEVDDIAYVGSKTFGKMIATVAHRCEHKPSAEVIFSPRGYDESHLARIAQLIDSAQRSIDVAIYSFSDSAVSDALKRAADRGVTIRLVFEDARNQKSKPAGTYSAKLEDLGVDVRYVNKIMHHKFIIIDGPRTSIDEAYTGLLVTGSANWSNGAATRYDENTVVLRDCGEIVLRFQREFNQLWDNSRDLVWNDKLAFFTSKPLDLSLIADEPGIDAVFTSANFTVTQSSAGPGFSLIDGKNEISDRLVKLIEGATKSIHIASGHLRSSPVANALLAKIKDIPGLDLRVYLDDQEYLSLSAANAQQAELDTCLTAAGSDLDAQQACTESGLLFSHTLHSAGIPLRYKFYAYRWNASYALQMHHKYMVFDGTTLISGSYNLSDNAEHETMENMVQYEATQWPDLVNAFEANFESIWVTGEPEQRYQKLMDLIANTTDPIPLVFDPIALDWNQVTSLKSAIRAACPVVDSDPYRVAATRHMICPR